MHLLSERDLTQVELARNIGVSKQAVNNWVNERSEPQFSQLWRICKFLDLHPWFFLIDKPSIPGKTSTISERCEWDEILQSGKMCTEKPRSGVTYNGRRYFVCDKHKRAFE